MKLKDMLDHDKNVIASKIEFNIKKEADANEYYFELLNLVADEDKDKIKEIISDELNHAIILGKLQEKYSGIIPNEFMPLITLKGADNNERN